MIEFLLREWEGDAYAFYLLDRFIFVVCGGSCTLLSSEDGKVTTGNLQKLNDLNCGQEEADKKITFHCQYISKQNPLIPIIVRSPQTQMCSSCFWHLRGNLKIHYYLTLVQEILEDY